MHVAGHGLATHPWLAEPANRAVVRDPLIRERERGCGIRIRGSRFCEWNFLNICYVEYLLVNMRRDQR